ncbi:MAG: putative transcriptional regulator [Herbinix sp.]|jgi:PadR family transcriptional regulator PadR|nr:putative transcriptional regulator [Herbinix sp.]
MDAQMKKGILEMCILYLVSKENVYGYDLIKIMHKYFPDVNESTFYAVLRRLSKDGSTEIYMGQVSGGPVRKYYKITENGIKYLNDSVTDWNNINEIIHIIGVDFVHNK